MPTVGTGITITFSSGFLAEINNVSDQGIARPAIRVTSMASTTQEYVPGNLSDQGTLEVEINFDPATPPPIDKPAETITIAYPDGTQWAREGFMTNFQVQAQIDPEDKITATATLQFTGPLTHTLPPP